MRQDVCAHIQNKIDKALDLIEQYGGIDGDHHKAWCIDQVVRALTGDNYENWVHDVKVWDKHEEEYIYDWDEGIAP